MRDYKFVIVFIGIASHDFVRAYDEKQARKRLRKRYSFKIKIMNYEKHGLHLTFTEV